MFTPDLTSEVERFTPLHSGARLNVIGVIPPPVVNFSANLSAVAKGQPVTFVWDTEGAEFVYLDGVLVAASGSDTIVPFP